MSDPPTKGSHAKAIKKLTCTLLVLNAANPNNRASKLVTICVCVVSVGYLEHNTHILTRMVV
jgi:hypothetical protein